MIKRLLFVLALLVAAPATAQNFPPLTGRVVDQANLLPPTQEAELTERLAALEQASSRQLVVATIASLEGYPIEDYGYQLGRRWRLGQEGANNGVILLVAPSERKVRIEVGYGLEPIVTDALSNQIIQQQILPRFRENDYPGGVMAGADAIIQQLQAPPEAAEQRALEAAQAQSGSGEGGSIFPLIFWIVVLVFILGPMLR
ncbi:MAG TPA: TPM domain-containing protein, partial [Allosphingosinicella sp.]|nr:TPM domain-containing protein [Allosphingosinicella sp.]